MVRQSSANRPKQAEGPDRTAARKQMEVPDMTNKIKMVGRSAEIEKLLTYLRARKTRHFLYYGAHGGLGKTRLLEELLARMRSEEPG